GVDGGMVRCIEGSALRRGGLNRVGDAIERQVGSARRSVIAELREIALVLRGGAAVICRRDGVETSLLLVAERLVEALERRAYGLHGRKHNLQPALHRRKPPRRDAG